MRTPRAKKPEHSPKCHRERFAVGWDMMTCGLCAVSASLELVTLRTRLGGYPTVPVDVSECSEAFEEVIQ